MLGSLLMAIYKRVGIQSIFEDVKFLIGKSDLWLTVFTTVEVKLHYMT